MNAVRWIKRALRAGTLAAFGLVSDAAAAADTRDARLDAEDWERQGEAPVTQVATEHAALPRGIAARALDTGRLAALVDQLGETEPALAAVLVGTALCSARPLERTSVVSEWATSHSVVRRRALARALAHPFMCPGVPSAIELLARDADCSVRTAAAHAALLRFGHDPRRYGEVLDDAAQRGVRLA